MADRHPQTVTMQTTAMIPDDFTAADIADVVKFHVGLSSLNATEADVSAVTMLSALMIGSSDTIAVDATRLDTVDDLAQAAARAEVDNGDREFALRAVVDEVLDMLGVRSVTYRIEDIRDGD